jgi:hypothetical protein
MSWLVLKWIVFLVIGFALIYFLGVWRAIALLLMLCGILFLWGLVEGKRFERKLRKMREETDRRRQQ